jgi:hypothetical protein
MNIAFKLNDKNKVEYIQENAKVMALLKDIPAINEI